MKTAMLLLFATLLVVGCGNDATGSGTSPTADHGAQAASPIEAPGLAVRVLSYNVLLGAGADRNLDQYLRNPGRYGGRSRVPDVVDIIQTSGADIVGIQEASGWTSGTPSVVAQVAEELGMHYYLAEAPLEFHLVLLSKFPIVSARNLSEDVGRNGALLAELLLPDGEPLHVFVVHLDPNSVHHVACQLATIHDQAIASWGERLLLMGDVNATFATPAVQQLADRGWTLAADEGIDQVWVAPARGWDASTAIIEVEAPVGVSDHPPVMAEVSYRSVVTDPGDFEAAPSRTCEEAPAAYGPIEPLAADRVLIESIGVDEPLRAANVSANYVLPSPSSEGVTAFDFSLTPGYGGEPGRGNLALAAGEGVFRDLTSLRRGDEIAVQYQGEEYVYRIVAVCSAGREGFLSLFYGTVFPMVTLFSFPPGEVFTYAVAELEPGSLPPGCTRGTPA